MKYLGITIIISLFFFNTSFSQKKDKDEPLKRKLFIEAHKYLQLNDVNQALLTFLSLYKIDSLNANVNYLVGFCYFSLENEKDKIKSIPYFTKSLSSVSDEYSDGIYKEKNAPNKAYYFLAQALYLDYKFDDAIKYFTEYRQHISDPKELEAIELFTLYAINGKTLLATPVKIDILNLGDTINSEYDDHSPVINISEDVMVFTSKRKGSTGNLKTTDGQYFEDIYISRKSDNKWGIPEKISYNINTMEHEASIALSVDGNELFIYKDDVGEGGNLYRSYFENNEWSKPEKLGSNINTEFDESHATISPDGTTLFFTSNRPGGYGGFDIYYVNRLPNGDWGLAQNIGPDINTKLDEGGPYIHPDGTTLYFSSKSYTSMGGYDLFFTIIKDDGTFAKPENLGYPINTINDDVFYVLSADGKRAYYSSQRDDSFGGKDIYLMDLVSLPERALVVVTGTIVKQGTNEPILDAVLKVNDAKTGKLIGEFKPNKTSGKYLLVLPKAKSLYTISTDIGEFVDDNLKVPDNSSFYYMQRPIVINPIGELK